MTDAVDDTESPDDAPAGAEPDGTVSDEDLAEVDATVSDEDLAEADAVLDADSGEALEGPDDAEAKERLELARAERDVTQAQVEVARAEVAVLEAEAGESPSAAGATPAASHEVEAAQAPASDGSEEGLAVSAATVLDALVSRAWIVVLLALAAFGVHRVHGSYEADRLSGELDRWEAALEAQGLPVPGVSSTVSTRPAALVDFDAASLERAGVTERVQALSAWSELLTTGEVASDLPKREGLGAMVALCVGLRHTDPDVVELRGLLAKVPGGQREALEVGCELASGQFRAAVSKADGLLRTAGPGRRRSLQVMRDAASQARIGEVLALRPPSSAELGELLEDSASYPALRQALEARAGSLPLLLEGGSPEIRRGEALVRLLVALYPDGLGEGSVLAPGWPAVRAPLGSLVGDRLARFDLDAGPALAILELAGRLDPKADWVPREQFAKWRETLNGVVDDPQSLLGFTQRFLELGWQPPGLQELVGTHVLGQDGISVPAATPGALLTQGVLSLAELQASGFKAERVEALLARRASLEGLLADRADPVARRIRARFEYQCGLALLGQERWADAEARFAAAHAMGFEPAFQLLGARQRAARGLDPRGPRALELAQAHVAALEQHAARARTDPDPSVAVDLELQGYPLIKALLDPLRCEAHLVLAEALLASGDAPMAGEACARAEQLDSRNPRNLLVAARVHQASGDLNAARKAVFKGLRAVREETIRGEFRALLKQLGPN